jgi:DNA-binding transcriptional MerR regulator
MTPPLSLPEHASIETLAAVANATLARMGVHVDDGRATNFIDGRTVRYYQTIGVLPKPDYDGRRALYSLTHLLRLVVAKRLQAEGHSLAQIQSTLPSRTDEELWKALEAMIPRSAARNELHVPQEPRMPDASRVHRAPAEAHASNAPHELFAFTVAPGVTVTIDRDTLAGATNAPVDPHAIAAQVKHVIETSILRAGVTARTTRRPFPRTES